MFALTRGWRTALTVVGLAITSTLCVDTTALAAPEVFYAGRGVFAGPGFCWWDKSNQSVGQILPVGATLLPDGARATGPGGSRYIRAPCDPERGRDRPWVLDREGYELYREVYFGGGVGFSDTSTNFNLTDVASASIVDPVPFGSRGVSTGGFVGDLFAGFTIPLEVFGNRVAVGPEVGVSFFAGSSGTIPGPFSTFPGSGTDTLTINNQWMVTATGVVQFAVYPNVTAFVKGGVAFLDREATYNCLGFCNVPPPTAPFSFTQSFLQTSPIVGAGLQFPLVQFIPSLQSTAFGNVKIRLEYDHVFGEDVSNTFGTPATRFIGGPLNTSMDKVTGAFLIPLGGGPTRPSGRHVRSGDR
jgi:hypothetical protein